MKKLSYALIFALILSLLVCGCSKKDETAPPEPEPPNVEVPVTPEPEPAPVPDGNMNPLTGLYDGISDEMLNRKPIAIMVSNSYDSLPQWGISRADIIYEMLAEGRITRFVTLWQDPGKIEKLASIRSSRPYFIDIAQSYGAVYIHCGGSVPAYEAIKNRSDLISFDGIKGPGSGQFERDPQRKKQLGSEHSVFLTAEKVENIISNAKKPLETTEHPSAFKFGNESSASSGSAANKITLHYSGKHTPSFEYNAQNGTYLRFQYGDPHMDALHDKQVEVKNVLVLKMPLRDTNNSLKLVEITATGTGEGYYFCGGKYVPITWKKDKYNSPITYYNTTGSELVLSPGQTFVSVIVPDSKVDIA